jgi:toxin-antitoxin system PIN domain toxin
VTFLLDVNVLISGIWGNHPMHKRAFDGLAQKSLAICPLVELGFIRISTEPAASIRAEMNDARAALQKFLQDRKVQRISDDLPALQSHPKSSKQVTDSYLAALAEKHGFKLATMDERINHPAASLI